MPTSENYIDRFETPQEFIRSEVLANRGTRSPVTKEFMITCAGWKAKEGEQPGKMTKAQLWDMLYQQYGDKVYTMFPVGVNSGAFQRKFGITHYEVKKLAAAGVIAVTGEYAFRAYGKNLHAKVFSAFDYFRLTPTEVRQALAELKQRRESKTPPTTKKERR